MATDIGTGATISFDDESSFMAEITDISWDGIDRAAIDISHMGTVGGRTFLPGDLYDPGELTVELHLDQDTTPPWDESAETVTVTLKDGAATATWVATGFLTGFNWNAPLEDKMTATAVIKFTDEIAVS